MTISTNDNRLHTLRNLASFAERIGLTEASREAFTIYWKGTLGRATEEAVVNSTCTLRDMIARRQGRDVASAIN